MSGEECGYDSFSRCAQLVAVGFLDFDDQCVGAQKSQSPCDGSRLSTALIGVGARAMQAGAEIAIAKAVDQEFTLGQEAEQVSVGTRKRVQGASDASAVLEDGSAERFKKLAQGGRFGDGGQAFGKPVVGGVADFGATA